MGVRQIAIKGARIAIIGLDEILDEVRLLGIFEEAELRKELLKRVEQRNYVPVSAQSAYADALLREYRGDTVEEVAETEGLSVKILGPGCPACDKLTEDVRNVLAEAGMPAEIEHIRDNQRIAEYGVMATPALIMNNRVKSMGRIPSKIQIKKWVDEAGKG